MADTNSISNNTECSKMRGKSAKAGSVSPEDPVVTTLDGKLLVTRKELLELSAREAGSVFYMPLPLVLCSLPYVEPIDPDTGASLPTFVRRMPKQTIRLGTARPDIGLIYGPYSRLIFAFVVNECLATGSPVIDLGSRITDMIKTFQLSRSGGERGAISRLKNHLLRFRYTTFLFERTKLYSKNAPAHAYSVDDLLLPAVETAHFWRPRNSKDSFITEGDNYMRLTQSFYNQITQTPVPIDMRAYVSLQSSAMAMDMYCYFGWMSRLLQRNELFSWEELKLQFGSDYARMVDFRRRFRAAMKKVLTVSPHLRAEDMGRDGVRLLVTSRPPVEPNKPLRIASSPEAKEAALRRADSARAAGKAMGAADMEKKKAAKRRKAVEKAKSSDGGQASAVSADTVQKPKRKASRSAAGPAQDNLFENGSNE